MLFKFENTLEVPWLESFLGVTDDDDEDDSPNTLTPLQQDKRRQEQRKHVAPESGFLIIVGRGSRNKFDCRTTNGRDVGGMECLDPVLAEMLFPGCTVIVRNGKISRQDRYIRSRSPSSFGDGTPIQV